MADYLIGGVIIVLVILAARNYFGKKYGSSCGGGCKSCPYSGKCHPARQRKD